MNKKAVLGAIGIIIVAALFWKFLPGGMSTKYSENAPTLNAVIASATGTVTVLHSDGKEEAAIPGLKILSGDVIWTRETAEASVEFYAGSRVALWHDTKLKIENTSVDEKNWKNQVVNLRLESGRIWSRILKLLDADSEYAVRVHNVNAVVRGTAFQSSVSGPIVQFDQFDGDLDVTGGATGTLRAGLTSSFNSSLPNISIASSQYFTPDQTRNDHWIRAQLRLDEEFAKRAGKIRRDAGVNEDISTVGTEAGPFTLDQPGITHSSFRGLSLDLNGVDEKNIIHGGSYQLKSLALLEQPDFSITPRDVTDLATWQTTDPSIATIEKGRMTILNDATGAFKVIGRWNDGTHEHSNEYSFIIQSAGGATTTIDTTVGPIMINGEPLQ